MTTPEQDPAPGTREHFLQVTTVQRWGTIQEYVELCRQHGYFTAAFYRSVRNRCAVVSSMGKGGYRWRCMPVRLRYRSGERFWGPSGSVFGASWSATNG